MNRILLLALLMVLALPSIASAQSRFPTPGGTFAALPASGAATKTYTVIDCLDAKCTTGGGSFEWTLKRWDGAAWINSISSTASMHWGAGALSSDGTNCADPAEATINGGPKLFTTICADDDTSITYGSTIMPDGWDGTPVVFVFHALNTAADTGVLEFDFSAMCRGSGDLVDGTWGSEPTPGSITFTTANDIETSAANSVTPNGTCTASGTHLFWRMSLDATATTTAVATAHLVGVRMEYAIESSD